MSSRCYRSEYVSLFGDPVDENPTVVIMDSAFRETGLDWKYITTHVLKDDLRGAVEGIRAMNFRGSNVTVPHKVEVMKYLDEISDSARIIGAVNTIVNRDGKLIGENTDGKGFTLALDQENVDVKGKKVVILGAGGAARAISVELAFAGVSEITVINRGVERGTELRDLINEKTPAEAGYMKWEKCMKIPCCDILVNATSIGLYPDTSIPDIDFSTLSKEMLVCDVIPNPLVTGLVKKAREIGCRTITGFAMLVNQGAIGFELWTGMKAPVQAMRDALEKEMN